jgi:hypothetical protein
MTATVSFTDTFQRADENPLASNGWSSTTLRLLNGKVISTSSSTFGRAVQATTVPSSADQDVTGVLACGSVNPFGQVSVVSLVAGSPATLTTATHGVGIGNTVKLMLFGVTTTVGAINPNGIVIEAIASGAATFTIATGIASGTYTTASAIAIPFQSVASVLGRVTGAASPPTTFRAGYEAMLSWDPTNVRRLYILRYLNDGATADQRVLLAQSTVTLEAMNGSDLGYTQAVKLSITDTRDGVRLRAYINSDDDDSPTLEITDRGRDFYLANNTPFLPICRAAGYFAVMLGPDATSVGLHNGPILDSFEGRDQAKVEQENAYAGRTRAQLREAATVEIGPSTNIQAAILNQFIQEEVDEFLSQIGSMALFARRHETMTLAADASYRVHWPYTVEEVEKVEDSYGLEYLPCDVYYTAEGRVITRYDVALSGDYLVTYYARQQPFAADDDRCIVPRNMDRAIVLAVAMRVHERDQDATRFNSLAALRAIAMRGVMEKAHRMARQSKKRMTPRRAVRGGITDRGAIW